MKELSNITESIIRWGKGICGGNSPWKSGAEVTRTTLRLANMGVNVAGLTEEEVLALARSSQELPKPEVRDNTVSEENQGQQPE